MAESAAQGPGQENEPQVRAVVDGDVVSVTVEGELTEAARRPLVRVLTDELLSRQPLRRVELQLGGVPYMNSAGMAVLVQLQRMAAPKGVDVALVTPSRAVSRPLQLTGLWHRFPLVDENGDEDATVISSAGPDGSPREHT
jgi:anti-anti-sigma factor